MKEVEIKFAVKDIEALGRTLLNCGFREQTPATHEMNTLYDTRTMAGSTTAWKGWWTNDQWKDYYLQMTSGPNNQLVRKITGNTSGICPECGKPTDSASS